MRVKPRHHRCEYAHHSQSYVSGASALQWLLVPVCDENTAQVHRFLHFNLEHGQIPASLASLPLAEIFVLVCLLC